MPQMKKNKTINKQKRKRKKTHNFRILMYQMIRNYDKNKIQIIYRKNERFFIIEMNLIDSSS